MLCHIYEHIFLFKKFIVNNPLKIKKKSTVYTVNTGNEHILIDQTCTYSEK